MFLAAPTSTGVRVRTLPIATLLLFLALLACAVWALPGREALRVAQRGAESALADSRAHPTGNTTPFFNACPMIFPAVLRKVVSAGFY